MLLGCFAAAGYGKVNPFILDVLHGGTMTPYSKEVELSMVTFFLSLREKDQRRYAAVEAAKLGSGGVPYLAKLLGIDPNTIRQGEADLKNLPDVPPEDVRKKGAAENEKSKRFPR
jgi:hypothetical protein